MITFEWDANKDKSNQKKHGVFFDENAVQFYDEEHSSEEDRFIMLGMSTQARVLVVCHCERNNGEIIRIISARKATKSETKYYQG
jgi:uncharacterized DUF497 family protein